MDGGKVKVPIAYLKEIGVRFLLLGGQANSPTELSERIEDALAAVVLCRGGAAVAILRKFDAHDPKHMRHIGGELVQKKSLGRNVSPPLLIDVDVGRTDDVKQLFDHFGSVDVVKKCIVHSILSLKEVRVQLFLRAGPLLIRFLHLPSGLLLKIKLARVFKEAKKSFFLVLDLGHSILPVEVHHAPP